jgi:hypothetical protein
MNFRTFVNVGVLIKRRDRALRNPGQLHARPRLSLRPYDAKCPIKYQLVQDWKLDRRIDKRIDDLAKIFNPIIRVWIMHYGRYNRHFPER